MSREDHWLEVFHRAQHENAAKEVEEILDAHPDIGLPASDAWMSRVCRSPSKISEVTLSADDISIGFGFDEDIDPFELKQDPVCAWAPADEMDRKSILRDLGLDLDPSEGIRLEGVLMESLAESGVAIYAVRNMRSRKTEGVVAIDRELTFFNDCAILEYEVLAFHCKDDPMLRGALFAAFHEQAITDLQGALDSMARAGVSPRLGYHLDAPTAELDDRFTQLVLLAQENLFEIDEMPHVDIEAYGSWLAGSKSADDNHVLIRKPKFRPLAN